jgi:hypothetical protein
LLTGKKRAFSQKKDQDMGEKTKIEIRQKCKQLKAGESE